MSDIKNNKKFLILLIIPYLIPMVDISYGTIVVFLVAILVSFAVKRTKFYFEYFHVFVFVISISSLIFVALLQAFNGVYHFYPLNYIFRYMCFGAIFFGYYHYIISTYDNRNQAAQHFAETLFWLLVMGSIFEYFLKLTNLNEILYFYKARQDLGGIDTMHYNRLSGFNSFPGDLSALIVLCFFCIFQFSRSYWKLLLLFAFLLLTQSKAGIAMVVFLFGFRACVRLGVKDIILITFFCSVGFYLVFHLNLEYFVKFIDDFEFYITVSKRAQEIFGYLMATPSELILGVNELHSMYESEWFSSLNRNGLLGTIWLIIPTIVIIVKMIIDKSNRNFMILLLSFLLVYCSISAGLSRSKISIFYIYFFCIALCDFSREKGGHVKCNPSEKRGQF